MFPRATDGVNGAVWQTPRVQLVVHTVGHGNRSLAELVAVLASASIATLVDVRALPASRRHPHFSRAALEASLRAAGVAYAWEGVALGGKRTPRADSRNLALREDAFRGYADHMSSAAFRAGLDRVTAMARVRPVAVMCAETDWRQCHRRLLADALDVRGVEVVHLLTRERRERHERHADLRVEDGALVYDAGGGRQRTLF